MWHWSGSRGKIFSHIPYYEKGFGGFSVTKRNLFAVTQGLDKGPGRKKKNKNSFLSFSLL